MLEQKRHFCYNLMQYKSLVLLLSRELSVLNLIYPLVENISSVLFIRMSQLYIGKTVEILIFVFFKGLSPIQFIIFFIFFFWLKLRLLSFSPKLQMLMLSFIKSAINLRLFSLARCRQVAKQHTINLALATFV
jgi:hypothetical protein